MDFKGEFSKFGTKIINNIEGNDTIVADPTKEIINLDDKVDEFINWYYINMVKGHYTDIGEYHFPRAMRDLIEKIAVWYELRYPDSKNDKKAFDKEIVDKFNPVDVYVGGKEHAAMHLIYARFMSKALRDLGYLSFDEPFKKLIHQGMILGPDGNKMSKSKGNTVSPEEYISKYGADIFRMYIMFGFDYRQGGPWDEKGIDSMVKYFTRIEKLTDAINDLRKNDVSSKESIDKKEKELLLVKSNTIKMMTNNLNDFRFNTAIARSMELYNALSNYIREEKINKKVAIDTYEVFIKLLAPLAPHFAEELWHELGKTTNVYKCN